MYRRRYKRHHGNGDRAIHHAAWRSIVSRIISSIDAIHSGAPVRHHVSAAVLSLAVLILSFGCSREPGELKIEQLNAKERQFVERFIVLERARAIVLSDPLRGTAVLDSLASAWGDTSVDLAVQALPSTPQRTARLYELIARLLEAEADSLIHIPSPRRLAAPLPNPRTTTP
jgi:hypothetical protein